MDVKISVLLVNLNNLEFTKNCINDLLNQDIIFNLRIVEQNSSEAGTSDYLNDFYNRHVNNGDFYGKINYLEIINSGYNRPLNHIWNEFAKSIQTPFGCLLNNDVRIVPNFLSSAIEVLEIEKNVGFVNHTTNILSNFYYSNKLNYKIIDTPYRQGWDPVFKKECYTQIPDDLSFFFGDDYIYSKLYSSGMKGAYVLNSPMIHFERSTTIEKGGQRDASFDSSIFYNLNLEFKNLSFVEEFSRWKPEF